jgi:NAD(P)-dependent dehydrogenase (short-subunit alcohol dehydrogenase family)
MAANENGSYAGKVAFVTGAESGISRATARAQGRQCGRLRLIASAGAAAYIEDATNHSIPGRR